jgi:hypothetical protein
MINASFARIVKAIGTLIGEPTSRIGGHSTRIGAAHDLAELVRSCLRS